MPRGWTDEEKARLKELLLDRGQSLFERLGLVKTTVDDLVRTAGISKGAFYQFYESKEALYFDVVERVEREIRTELAAFTWTDGPPYQNLKRFFQTIVAVFAKNPFLRSMAGTERSVLETRLPTERLTRHQREDEAEVVRLFQTWVVAGRIRAVDWKAFTSILQQFVLVLSRLGPAGEHASEVELWIDMLSRLLEPGMNVHE